MMKIAVLHGPNLNRLGKRRPDKYGSTTLADITADVDLTATQLGVSALHEQSNHEGVLVEFVHDKQDDFDGIVINPAGLTPCGYSLLDALCDTGQPFAVVHISQFHAMDGKERQDIFASSASVYISGAGWRGYAMALQSIVHQLRTNNRGGQSAELPHHNGGRGTHQAPHAVGDRASDARSPTPEAAPTDI